MSVANQYMTLVRRPAGEVKPTDFKIVEEVLPELEDGQVLIKNLCFSLDPYMRGRMNEFKSYAEGFALGKPLLGHSIGRIEKSKNALLKEGDLVLCWLGWQTYAVITPQLEHEIERNGQVVMKLPEDIKPSLYLGILGVPGLTAYHGLMKIGEPKPGETFVVASALGPVGTMVGQLAKAQGCRVVGIAGGPEKCKFAVEVLGFDACIDHKSKTMAKELKEACPKGIDIYFENVGGPVLRAVLPMLNIGARVPLCGLIHYYNEYTTLAETNFSMGQLIPRIKAFFKMLVHLNELPLFLLSALGKRIKIQGFIVADHFQEYPEFLKIAEPLVREGKVKYREHIVKGLENAPETFADLIKGRVSGKVVIEL